MTPMRVTEAEKALISALRTGLVVNLEALLTPIYEANRPQENDPYLERIRRDAFLRNPDGTPKISSARIMYCPNCNPVVKLERVEIDAIYAEKRCNNCKRRFTFFQDTPEGKRAKMAELRYQRKQLHPFSEAQLQMQKEKVGEKIHDR